MYFETILKNRFAKFRDNHWAIWPFFKKRLYYNFIADRYVQYYKNIHFLGYNETINHAIQNNLSIIRFGDELFDMLQGIGLYFNNWKQVYNPDLANRLKEVISSRNSRALFCFNFEFIGKTRREFIANGISKQWHFWTNSKIFLKDYLHTDMTYGSALCFNPNFNTSIDYLKLKSYFSKKHIIIIASNTSRLVDINLGITTDFIEGPKSNAWNEYEDIKYKLFSLINKNNYNQTNTLVLVSISSAGKVLAYDMTQLGYIVWDTGQFFDLAQKNISIL